MYTITSHTICARVIGHAHAVCKNEMLTAIIIVARVQPGTSKGITDLLLPQPSSGLKKLQRSL